MGDLKDQNTSYPTVKDTATEITIETALPAHINGPVSAVLAIENELGTGLKGVMAVLATRLLQNIATDGGLLRDTAFPLSPANTPHLFYRTDIQLLYIYNIFTATYDVVSTATVLSAYVPKAINTVITATHTFNPTLAGDPPFVIGSNATGVKIDGLNADQLDGYHAGTGNGNVPVSTGTKNTNLNADMLEGYHANTAAGANQIPVIDGSSVLTINGDIAIPNALSFAIKDSTGAFNTIAHRDVSNITYLGDLQRLHTGFLILSGTGESAFQFETQPGEIRTVWHSGNAPLNNPLSAGTYITQSITETEWVIPSGIYHIIDTSTGGVYVICGIKNGSGSWAYPSNNSPFGGGTIISDGVNIAFKANNGNSGHEISYRKF